MSRTGMSRSDLMETYYLMRQAQEDRIALGWYEDDRSSYLQLANSSQCTDRTERAVTLPAFLKSMRAPQPPSQEEMDRWERMATEADPAVAATWHSRPIAEDGTS